MLRIKFPVDLRAQLPSFFKERVAAEQDIQWCLNNAALALMNVTCDGTSTR
jgi:hypothetical protein